MPFVTIKITDTNVTKQKKSVLVKGVTDLLTETLKKDPKTTHIVIEEIPLDNWGYNASLTSELPL